MEGLLIASVVGLALTILFFVTLFSINSEAKETNRLLRVMINREAGLPDDAEPPKKA